MRRKRLAVLALVGYFVSLLLFQSRLTWENFYRQTHIVETPRPPFTLGRNLVLDSLRPEARDAGLQAGDLLLAIDGAVARGERSPQAVVDLHKAGDVMLVTVERGGPRSRCLLFCSRSVLGR